MKKIMKKRFWILSIMTFCISVLIIFLLSNNDNAKIEIAKEITDEIETNSTIPVDENVNANNEIVQDIVNSNIDNEQTSTTESIVQDTIEVTKDNSTEKKQTVTQQVKVVEKKTEEKQTKQTTLNKTEVKQQETIVSNTKEETSKTETSTPKQENTQTNTNNQTKMTTKDETTSNYSKPVDTIKRISKEELQAEKAKYLNDIQSIKPGLKYKEAKRGQIFWPYRTTEIETAVGGVSFGTVYYYVDVFVEGNQEKFKYYIDWTGE